MPTADNNGVSLYYDTAGSGEPVAFIAETGLGGWSWGWQHAALAGPYECLVWDLRGTGRSDTPPGPYSLETLVADFETVLADAGIRSAHVVGTGLGAAVALSAARTTNRVKTLTLFSCGPAGEDFDLKPLFAPPADREALRSSLESGFSEEFQEAQPDVLTGIVDWRADGDATREGWEAQRAALEGFDASDWAYEVTQPALVFHGTADTVVTPKAGRKLADGLPRGTFEPLEGAGHLASIEHSRVVNDRLVATLESAAE